MREEIVKLSTLVIEDNQMFLDLAVEMLSPHHTISAKTAAEGISQYNDKHPDITFIDIGLPDKSGMSVLEEIKGKNPDAFIVMLTASNIQKDVFDSLNFGANAYIIKPFSRKKIKDIIELYNQQKK
jgi:two-component system chemotaxis response regulator CheY